MKILCIITTMMMMFATAQPDIKFKFNGSKLQNFNAQQSHLITFFFVFNANILSSICRYSSKMALTFWRQQQQQQQQRNVINEENIRTENYPMLFVLFNINLKMYARAVEILAGESQRNQQKMWMHKAKVFLPFNLSTFDCAIS